jgi:hypothetical protein
VLRISGLVALTMCLPSLAIAAEDDSSDGTDDDEPELEAVVEGRIPVLQAGVVVGVAEPGALVGLAARLRVDLGPVVPYLEGFGSLSPDMPWYGGRAGIVFGLRRSLPLVRRLKTERTWKGTVDTYGIYHARRTPAVFGLALGMSYLGSRDEVLVEDDGSGASIDAVTAAEGALAIVSGQYELFVGPFVDLSRESAGLHVAGSFAYPAGSASLFLRTDLTVADGLGTLALISVGVGDGLAVDFPTPTVD